RAVQRRRRACESLCAQSAGLRVGRYALARAELPVGSVRGSLAVWIGGAAAASRRSGYLSSKLRDAEWRVDRCQRDARLRRAAVYHRAQPVLRARAPAELGASGGRCRPRRAVRRVWMGTRVAVLVNRPGVAGRRSARHADRTVAPALLDADGRWRR